jgi:hypothetical protein
MTRIAHRIQDELEQVLLPPRRLKELEITLGPLVEQTRYASVDTLMEALYKLKLLRKFGVKLSDGKTVTLYSSAPLSKQNPYDMAVGITPNSYFCNLTSIYYHALTDQIPAAIYIASEEKRDKDQSRRAPRKLTDGAIRKAFMRTHRISQRVCELRKHSIVFTSRVFHDAAGTDTVKTRGLPCPTGSHVTCLERALIDAVVNPHYNGGLPNLPSYFRNALRRVKVDRLIDIYDELHFIYPYWQALGFFCDNAGLHKAAAALRKGRTLGNRFYVDHSAKSSWILDKKWRVYHPPELVHDD